MTELARKRHIRMGYRVCTTRIIGQIKSTNMLMPRWWLHGHHAHWMQLFASNSSKSMQPNYSFVYSSRTVRVGYVHRRLSNTMCTCTIWACARLTYDYQWCKQCAVWRACSRDFTRVAVYLVVQMELLRRKVVCCGQPTLRWTLDRWQWPSRWAHHAVTSQQSLKAKI